MGGCIEPGITVLHFRVSGVASKLHDLVCGRAAWTVDASVRII